MAASALVCSLHSGQAGSVGTRNYLDWLAVLTENSYGLPKLLTRLEAKSL